MRNIIHKLLDNRLVYILVSLVAAFMLWIWVVNSVNPSDTRSITFEILYEGVGVLEQYHLRLASDVPESVRMRVTASATDLNQLQQNPQIIVDVSNIRESGEHDASFRLAAFHIMTSNVDYTVFSGAVSNTRNTIMVRTNRVTGRSVPLDPSGITAAFAATDSADYFYVGERPSVYPETIHIDGPLEILDQIGTIEVVAVFPPNLSETTTQTGTLRVYNHEGEEIPESELADVLFSQEALADVTVSVTVAVRMVRNVPLRPVFEFGAGANEYNLNYSLNVETAWLIGDVDVLRGVEHLELAQIRLDRVGIIDSVRREIPRPALTEIFSGPEYVDVGIHIQGVDEHVMTIPSEQVVFTGVPDGIRPEMALDSIELIIRGPEEILAELDESAISILVNLSDYVGQTGRVNVDVFAVRIGDWDPEVVGARDQPWQGVIVNLQRQ